MAELEGNNGGVLQVVIDGPGEEKSKGPKGTSPKEAEALNPKQTSQGNEPDANKSPKSPIQKRKGVKPKVVIEWVVFLLLIGCLVASLTIGEQQNILVWGWEIWKWCLLLVVIFCGMLVTRWFIHLVIFLIEHNFSLRNKVLYFVHGLRKRVQVFIWLSIVLATGVILFLDVERSKSATRVAEYVTWTLVTMVIGSFFLLLNTLLLKVLTLKFSRSNFFHKIRESLLHQYILMTLSGQISMECDGKPRPLIITVDAKKVREIKGKRMIDIGKIRRLKRENVSAWDVKLFVDAIRKSRLSTIFSNKLEESACDEQADITDEEEATHVAHQIFKRILAHDCNRIYIHKHDLLRFMTEEEVDLVFPLFEGSSTGKIDEWSFTHWVIKVYQFRKTLMNGLDYNKTAVKQLHTLVTSFLFVVTIIVWLLLSGIATIKLLLLLSSQLVAVAFMFGNTCKTIFEGIVFVFVMHPFDVGDRCVVDGVPLLVERMNILTTIFLKPDNEKVYYPNSVLATMPIGNYYRSPDMGDTIEFSIDFMTPVKRIGKLKEEIKKHLEAKNTRWHPNHLVVVKEIENVNKLKMALYCNHKMNFQDLGEKSRRRTDLIIELKEILGRLGIRYKISTM